MMMMHIPNVQLHDDGKLVETDKIALYVGIRIGDRVTNSCLSCEIYDNSYLVVSKYLLDSNLI